ncbi:hypothetical protein HAX54_032196 [Datura stramonium]|uniref:Uncharacterized protein n=1 Tax=Datura stramonium TaxID=4076 RepID=A0ABS8VBV6_DATST|nr:hypothetical protein [Datura stramonium]
MAMNLEVESSKKVMSFWIFLGSRDLDKFYHKISSCDKMLFKNLYTEAETALNFLESNSPSVSQYFCPLTSEIFNPSLEEILSRKEKVNNEISFIYDAFCSDGFEDTSIKMNLALNSKLNPFVNEWNPSSKAVERNRTLSMAFSYGHYFFKKQVLNFFIRMCGEDAVQNIFLYKKEGVAATFGKVIFKNTSICVWVLNGGHDEKGKYYIEPGYVYLKKYERRLL